MENPKLTIRVNGSKGRRSWGDFVAVEAFDSRHQAITWTKSSLGLSVYFCWSYSCPTHARCYHLESWEQQTRSSTSTASVNDGSTRLCLGSSSRPLLLRQREQF